MYDNLSTNAQVLNVGDQLTRDQIDAIANLEDAYTEQRGHVTPDQVEDVLHAFICQAMHDCVCTTKKEVY
jgi:hypothetical protein